jgi:hypothetical protein
MPNPTGLVRNIPLDVMIEAYKRNGCRIGATARELGCANSNVNRRLHAAILAGDERLSQADMFKERVTNRPMEEIIRARAELGMRNDRKVEHGDWRKASYLPLTPGPFMLGVFGDPHIDNSGTDLEALEDDLARLDKADRIFGCCVGDLFDNWPRALGHLYAESGNPEPAWIWFEYMMGNFPWWFTVMGNHDLFSGGTANFLVEFFRGKGMLLRRSGGRFIIGSGPRPITVSMRHIWPGGSMYSEAHSLKRAVTFGYTDDDVVVGGHIHKGEIRDHVRPSDRKRSKLVQVSSYKRLDNFANDRGFMSAETPPTVWLVCDDREPYDSPSRVQDFYDFDAARAMLEHRRSVTVGSV